MNETDAPQKTLSETQKRECAKVHMELSDVGHRYASQRGSELADEYTRLEVQIAAILFAFAGLFLNYFDGSSLENYSPAGILWMQIGFGLSIFLLMLSLVAGLLHMKRKELFWDRLHLERSVRAQKWRNVLKKETTYEEAAAFHEGTVIDGQLIRQSPTWTWVLQTIFLGAAIVIIYILSMVLLFK